MYPKAILQSAVSCLIYTMTKKGKDFCFNCHLMMLKGKIIASIVIQ